MQIRELQEKDASLMLEWMHDKEVTKFMNADFENKQIEDCLKFINTKSDSARHFAIVSNEDTYMGTVSLKNITKYSAEFAITVRREAMGQGYSSQGMKFIIDYGLSTLNLDYIYWYVSKSNEKAIRFYDKNQYQRVDKSILKKEKIDIEEYLLNDDKYIWYQVVK